MVKAAKLHKGRCRVANLSFTPGDQPKHYPQILRMVGIITCTELYHRIPFDSEIKYRDYGLGQLEIACRKANKNSLAKDLLEQEKFRMSAAKAYRICKELYDVYIGNTLTFAMPKPNQTITQEFYNAFLETDPKSLKILNTGIACLSKGLLWNGVEIGDKKDWDLGSIVNGLKLIEEGKLLSIAHYVQTEIEKKPNKKFVICCGARGTKNHYILQQMLHHNKESKLRDMILKAHRNGNQYWKHVNKDIIHYMWDKHVQEYDHPDVINGKVKENERIKILDKFQENNLESWCLIISPGTGSESVSLQDKWGDHPREMLIVPDYFFSRIVQSAGRINRIGQKSNSKTLIVYSKDSYLETKLLDSMVRKSGVLKDLLAKDQKVKFPGDYPYFIQGNKDENYENIVNWYKDRKLIQ